MLLVISPDLIREVEARMNRNYLPPSLMSATANIPQSNVGGQSIAHNSPPPASPRQIVQTPSTSNNIIIQGTRSSRYGRTCKLPTVQEIGKYYK